MKRQILFLAFCFPAILVMAQGIIIRPGAYMTVGSDAYVKTTGTAGLTLESDQDGTASLLDEEGNMVISGEILSKRYIAKNAWHIVSPNTTGVTARAFYWNDNPQCWLTYHQENDNTWHYNTDLSTNMPLGQGWMVWLDNAYGGAGATVNMSGDLFSDDLSPAITYGGSNWNLTGNPFPCALDWSDAGWTRTNIEGTVWIWDNPSNNYLYRTTAGGGTMASGIIPQGQGFFVKSTGSSPVLTIPAQARQHSSQAFYKNTGTVNGYADYLVLRVSQESQADAVWVSFGENGSEAFENGWDATKLRGGESAPQLYLPEQGRQQSINHLYTLSEEEERIVPVHFKAGTNATHLLTADLVHFTGKTIILDDLQTGQSQYLTENPVYVFQGNVSDPADRFRLRFRKTLGVPSSEDSPDYVHTFGGKGTVHVRLGNIAPEKEALAKVYSVTGAMLGEFRVCSGSDNILSIPDARGCLIVKVTGADWHHISKVFVK